jgi:hypothetical protein
MLESEQGESVPPICAAQHWRMLELMLREPALSTPLRTAINRHIDSVIAAHQQGQRTTIDPTAEGPGILGALPGPWPGDYNQWHATALQQQPNLRAVASGQMYGMMLWYVLASDRQETWRISRHQGRRVYELRVS